MTWLLAYLYLACGLVFAVYSERQACREGRLFSPVRVLVGTVGWLAFFVVAAWTIYADARRRGRRW